MVNVREVLNEDAGDFSAVRPGEVCSIETAKLLGVFDAAKYYEDGMGDVRTYGDRTRDDAKRRYKLCTEDAENYAAQPLCPLVGPGLRATADGACAFQECPPGFTASGGGVCKKQVIQNAVPKAARCDAQWHDWFTVPNAHIGNGYRTLNGACYAACPGSTVPASGTDPSTGKRRGDSKDDACVDKMEYLGGKFADDSDFCSIAWVKRMAAEGSGTRAETRRQYPKFVIAGSKKVRDGADAAAEHIVRQAHSRLENVQTDSPDMQGLCKSIETPERLAETYATCKSVLADTDGSLYRSFRAKLLANFPTMREEDAQKRWRVLSQACHHSFCDSQSGGDRTYRVGADKPQLCFPADRIARMDMDGMPPLAPPPGPRGGAMEFTPPTIQDDMPDLAQGYHNLSNHIMLIGMGTVVFLLVGVFFYYLWLVVRGAGWYDGKIKPAAIAMLADQGKRKAVDLVKESTKPL